MHSEMMAIQETDRKHKGRIGKLEEDKHLLTEESKRVEEENVDLVSEVQRLEEENKQLQHKLEKLEA